MAGLTKLQRRALVDAAECPAGGWGLFNRKTTAKLAERGFFERAQHPSYGEQWRITEAGRRALDGESK